MRISKDNTSPFYQPCATHSCEVYRDGELLEHWVEADDERNLVWIRREIFPRIWGTVRVPCRKVEIVGPMGLWE